MMMSKTAEDFRFTEDVYTRVCELAGKGELQELKGLLKRAIPKGAKLGPTTFCPPPKYHLKSPLVEAAHEGHQKVVRYLLETYPGIIDINCGATILTKVHKIYSHNVPPINAAASSGNLELVKYLVEKGADLHKLSRTRATPLRMASFFNHTDIMEYLIKCGADVNRANCIGSGPLHAAAYNGGAEAIKLLLEKGADVHQYTIRGHTVLHEACRRGKLEVVRFLLKNNFPPLFTTSANSTNSGYIPCPLYIAASAGHSKIVDLLLEHKDCPLQCAVDAYLLLGTSYIEFDIDEDVNGELELTKIRELWLKALQIKEKNSIEIAYPPQRKEYSQSVEINTTDHLKSIWDGPEFLETEIYIQSLLIQDRVLGINDQSLIECLTRRGIDFCQLECFKEAEGIWERAIQVEMHLSEVECSHPEYGYCDGLQTNIEGDLNDFVEGVQLMYIKQYIPNHDQYIQFGLTALMYFERLSNKVDIEISNEKALMAILKLIFYKVAGCHSKANESIDQSQLSSKLASDPLMKELVANYLFYSEGNTLLHLAIDVILDMNPDRLIVKKWYIENARVFVEALLKAGTDQVINFRSTASGDMPIHRAFHKVYHFLDLLGLLVEYGAHPDAINSHRFTMLMLTKSELYKILHGPLSLYCIVANAIVGHSLPYQSVGLPQHVVDFVDMHNFESIKIIKDAYF